MPKFLNLLAADGSGPDRGALLRLKWQEFVSQCPDDGAALAELHKIVDDYRGVGCKKCHSMLVEKERGERSCRCHCCGTGNFFTAGTFFDGIRRPMAWLGAIWLVGQGIIPSAASFAKLAGVSTSTAWEILKKIKMVVQDQMEEESLTQAISSACYLGAICKRSLKTPADAHPIAEQAEMEKKGLNQQGGERVNSDLAVDSPALQEADARETQALSPIELAVYEVLSSEHKHLDFICSQIDLPVGKVSSALMMLVLEGLVERQPGELYSLATPVSPPLAPGRREQSFTQGGASDPGVHQRENIAVGIAFIRDNFHGVSRKYLQLFLAAHWCHVDRGRWSPRSLLMACSRFRAVSYEEILAYVSPLSVKIVPC